MSPSRSPIAWVAALQSLGLALLLWALAGGQLSLLLALLPAALLVWLPVLPVLLVRPAAAESTCAVDAMQISQLSRELSQTTTQNALSAAEVAYAVKQLGERLRSQLQAADSIVGSAQNMIATEEQTSLLSQQTAGAALQVRQSSDEGLAVVQQTIARMHQLSQRASASQVLIETLSKRSEDIQRVTQVIQSIASQTNLLALNAATEEVGQMVADIQQQTAAVVAQIQQLAGELHISVGAVEQAGGGLEQIAELAQGVAAQIGEIAQGAHNNRDQLGSLFGAVEQMRGDLAQSDAHTRRLGAAAERLEGQAEQISERLAAVALDDYHQRVLDLAREGAQAIAAQFEADIERGRIRLEDLLDRDYQAIANTWPQQYRSRFDDYTDKTLPALQEPLLSRHEGLVFAIACTPDGYVPTHNLAFSAKPTGDREHDMAHSRSKRLFNDRTGARCGSHQQALLLQTYTRDTGELMHDLSVPIMVKGRHWGGLRLGYKPEPVADTTSRSVRMPARR
ncbi:MAG: chemotaxis protein [Pseudomonas sp. PGPPP3]|nr:MAG: chemotaxis protein [Pseudomonas sp. PGPPP3]